MSFASRVKWLSLSAALSILANAMVLVLLGIPLGLPSGIVRWAVFVVVAVDLILELVTFMFWKPVTKQKPRPPVKKSPTTKKGVTS